jgi:nitronate monooxygenase
MMWRTPLCDLLGIDYPIIKAPMAGGPDTPELVAAVSNAGGLGVLACTQLIPDQLRQAIRTIKAQTDQPFGVNFLLAPPEPGNHDVAAVQEFLNRFRQEFQLPPGPTELSLPPSRLPEQLQVVFEEQVPVVSFGLGDPGQLVASAHAAGSRVMAMVTTVEEAVQVVENGVDIVVAQGAEAGGHRSTFKLDPNGEVPLVGTLALVPQVVDAIQVPVVAAGGIMDGRGLVAVLALGAAGASLGTRFLVARESGAVPAWQECLLAATEVNTVVTRAFTGRPARGIRNRFIEAYLQAGAEPLAWPLQRLAADDIYRAASAQGMADYFPVLTGQGLRLLKRGQGAAEIVAELVAEAKANLSRLADLPD